MYCKYSDGNCLDIIVFNECDLQKFEKKEKMKILARFCGFLTAVHPEIISSARYLHRIGEVLRLGEHLCSPRRHQLARVVLRVCV
jgi:hypothetical protein